MLKRTSYILLAILVLATGCKKDYWSTDVNTTITTVATAAPASNISLTLDPLSNAVVTFEWSAAKTGNHTPVYYKVLFATESGHFSVPVYVFTPASMGTKNTLV